jgi:hypothetical protein
MPRKRIDTDGLNPAMGMQEAIAYRSFNKNMNALRMRPFIAVSAILLACIIVGWLILLNHS